MPRLVGFELVAHRRRVTGCEFPQVASVEPLFEAQRRLLLARAVDQPVARHLDEKGAELLRVRELPAAGLETGQQVGPHRLHDVQRVEADPQRRRQLPPHHHPQVRLVRHENALGRPGVAGGQLLEERFERVGRCHSDLTVHGAR
jgi:hypothetical protein